MNRNELLEILQQVRDGDLDTARAVDVLSGVRIDDIGHSKFDGQRELRSGVPEVIYAEGKQTVHLLELIRTALDGSGRVLVTRLLDSQVAAVRDFFSELTLFEPSRLAVAFGVRPELDGTVAVVTAGTSDAALAEEVTVCGQFLGVSTRLIADVGVAALPRLLEVLPELRSADVVVVVAGMEGALPSVVSGLVEAPVIAVPTSVGYGASFRGIAALLGMLVSCSPGITVVNIDNGFGAALAAVKMIKHLQRNKLEQLNSESANVSKRNSYRP